MLLLSSFTTQSPFHSPKSVADAPKLHHSTAAFCRASTVAVSATATSSHKSPPLLSLTAANASSSSLANGTSESLRHVGDACAEGEEDGGEPSMVPSASAVASAIRRASNSPVEFEERIEKEAKNKGLVLPSHDFRRLCLEQLDLFRRVVDPDAVISVYVRPAGSYVMDRLELRRVTFHPGVNASAEILILLGNFSIPTGLRAAEAILSNQQAEFIPEYRAVVLPMVKHPFVVGFLVAELPKIEIEKECHDHDVKCPLPEELYAQPSQPDSKSWEIRSFREKPLGMFRFTAEQRLNAVNICHSIAMAYVMDQKAMLLQQSSWQNNVRMSTLVEQIRGPLSSIRTLSKLLSVQIKRSEQISSDIVEDILVQGDRIRDTLEQLQDAVYLTKANIMRFNEETLKKMHQSTHAHPESVRPHLPSNTSRDTSIRKMQESAGPKSVTSKSKDLELPMPPLALAPLQPQGIRRPSNVSDILADLVGAVKPLAHRQQRIVELCEVSTSLSVAVEEPALRQALSNLIEGALLRTHVGGKVEIVSTGAPAGGALVIIDDDGPDMHYMTQMHSLTPFGSDLFSSDMIEDNMTWNFVAGLTVAREILESYGCVVRVISPRTMDAALGTGGTRIELWLPSLPDSPDPDIAPRGNQ